MYSTEGRTNADGPSRCKSPLINSIQLAGLSLFLLTFCGCPLLCQIFHCRSAETKPATDKWEECANQIQPRLELQGKAREVAYQADIARSCTMRGADDCKLTLAARHSVDSFAAASQLIAGTFTPAQYLAVSRDRARKRWAAEDTPPLAAKLCSGADADGDFVPDDIDKCPNTPDLTATDNAGCTDSTLPKAPSADDVRKLLDRLHLMIAPLCKDAPRPMQLEGPYLNTIGPWPPILYSGRVTNNSKSCPMWYQFEIEERVENSSSLLIYSIVFRDNEEGYRLGKGPDGKTKYIEFTIDRANPARANFQDYLGRIVKRASARSGVPFFVATPTDPPRIRVRAINGNGIRGPWSIWQANINNKVGKSKQ